MPKTLSLSIAAIAALSLLLYIQSNTLAGLKKEIKATQEQRDTARATLATANQVIGLQQQLAKSRQQQLDDLQQQSSQLQQQASQRKIQLNEVYHAKDNTDWANTALPSDIKRLRQRPSITSARDYSNHLRNAQPLPAASYSTANQ